MTKGIILAAGRGSRMGPLTDDRPKCFVEFRGVPLIRWQTDALTEAGVREIAVVRGYRQEYWDRVDLKVSRYFENQRWADSQMVTSLVSAEEWLSLDDCVVSYSDIVYGCAAVQTLLKAAGDIAITYDPGWLDLWKRRFEDPLTDAETFRIDDSGRLLAIGGKTDRVEDIQGQYMGLLKFTPRGWSNVRGYLSSLRSWDRLDMTSLLAGLLRAGVAVSAMPVAEPWYEIDSESDLRVGTGE